MLSVELHAHSSHSHDGFDPVESLLERAAERGLDGLAVTDHDQLTGSREALELAPAYDLTIIPAIEVSSEAGHVLALGVEELIPSGLSFEKTVECIHDADGTAVIPHPYQKLRKGVLANVEPEALKRGDAIEVLNSRFVTGWSNRKARKLAEELEMPVTAGSDAHVSEMVGQTVTLVDTEQDDCESILEAIRDGRTSVAGRRTPYRITFQQAAGTARRRVRRKVTKLL